MTVVSTQTQEGGESKQLSLSAQTITVPSGLLYYILTPEAKTFADQAEANLYAFFKSLNTGHNPQGDLKKGLKEIICVYAGQLYDCIPDQFWLSSAPTGVGKTQALVECVKLHVSKPELKEHGVVIFLEQLDQIASIVKRMGLQDHEFACLTMDDNLHGKNLQLNTMGVGRGNATIAQVLFTTQRRLEALAEIGKPFSGIPEFWYRGKTRKVRTWDEAVYPSAVFTIGWQDLDHILGELPMPKYEKLYEELEAWKPKLRKMTDGITDPLPPSLEPYFTNKEDWVSKFDKHRDLADAYWEINGKRGLVVQSNDTGGVSVQYKDTLPDDLCPLILDASGEIRHTYELWSKHRNNLTKLESGTKLYDGITFHVCDVGAGKNSQQSKKRQDELVKLVIGTLEKQPLSAVPLVLSFKKSKRNKLDWNKTLKESQAELTYNYNFIHWGEHTSTNKYASTETMLIIGLLDYPAAEYEGQLRGVKREKIEAEFDKEGRKLLRESEIAHNLFQAVGRCRVRECHGNRAPDGIHIYLACKYKNGSITRKTIEETFPGCTVVEDWHIDKEPKGKVLQTLLVIDKALETEERAHLPAIRDEIDMDKGSFNKRVLQHHSWEPQLKARGYVWRKAMGPGGSYIEKEGTSGFERVVTAAPDWFEVPFSEGSGRAIEEKSV